VALGTSIPTSTTDVVTKISIFFAKKSRIIFSFSSGFIRPCKRPILRSGNIFKESLPCSSIADFASSASDSSISGQITNVLASLFYLLADELISFIPIRRCYDLCYYLQPLRRHFFKNRNIQIAIYGQSQSSRIGVAVIERKCGLANLIPSFIFPALFCKPPSALRRTDAVRLRSPMQDL